MGGSRCGKNKTLTVRVCVCVCVCVWRLADLVTYCETEGVPFRTFATFDDILDTMKKIVAGELSAKDAAVGRK